MTTILTLGGILFSDFEVPEKISFGGEHQFVVHKLPGGARVIDAMGRDDADISWAGRFRGNAAEFRARSLDFMRISGQPVELVWSTFRYQVLVRSFEADFQQPFEIPYRITCMVVTDETSPFLKALLGLDEAIGVDLNQVLQVGAELGIPNVSTAIAGVETATSAVQTFQGASANTVSGVQQAISAAQTATNAAIDTNNATVAGSSGVAGMVAGLNPANLASTLSGQASAFSALGNLYQVKASLGRMFTNVSNPGG